MAAMNPVADSPRMNRPAVLRLLLALGVGAAAAIPTALAGSAVIAVVAGWIGVAGGYSALTWHVLRGMTADEVRDHATQEEPGRRGSHIFLLVASVFSLVSVGVLLRAGRDTAGSVPVEALVGTASVAASWVLVHLLFALRYAAEYYADPSVTPVDFSTERPDYQDFAYLAFTLGMTYQVSDTALQTSAMRRLVLRHTLLAYLLGAVVIASTINLVVQLASGGGGV